MVDQLLTSALTQNNLRGIAMAALLAWAFTLCACAGGTGSDRSSYRDHYEAGRYQLALASARAQAGQPGGSSDAALVAGLAAEAMREDATARAWLRPIARGVGDTAARARAGLALIELRTGDPLQAARELEAASVQLTGMDGREAARVAALAYERAGRTADAERLRRRAIGVSVSGDERGAAYSASTYTLQVGAYSTRSRASQRVAEVSSAARSAGLGEPRVELVSRNGQSLYRVQIGRFETEADAQRAQRTLGVSTIVSRL